MRPFLLFLLPALLLLAAAACAEDRDQQPLFNTFFLDAERVLIRLTLNRDRTCELGGPEGQVLVGRFVGSDGELLIVAGEIRRHFAYRFENGDLLLTPTRLDRPGEADLLGGMSPTRRDEERRYVSLSNWRAKGRADRRPAAKAVVAADAEEPRANQEVPAVLRRVAADVPMRLLHERILLPIKINDEIECNAFLDTGARHCVLDLSQIDLKKPRLEGEQTLLFPYIGKVEARKLALRSIALGQYRLENCSLPAVKDRMFWGRHAPFLLGMEMLKGQPFTLDFENRRFVLWMPGSVLPVPSKATVRLKLDLVPPTGAQDSRPHIHAGINGTPNVLFLVDTGAPDTFFLRALNPVAQGFTERRPLLHMPTYVGDNFQDLPVWATIYKQIDLGEWHLKDQVGSILDLSAQRRRVYGGDLDSLMNVVGTEFLRTQKAVHFDIPNKAMYLDRAE